jgi:hypothetical protein
VREILSYPRRYSFRPELAADAAAAFFEVMWSHKKIGGRDVYDGFELDVFPPGPPPATTGHVPVAWITVTGSATCASERRAPAILRQAPEIVRASTWIYHRTAGEAVREVLARFFLAQGSPRTTPEAFIARVQHRGERNTELFAESIARSGSSAASLYTVEFV